MQGVTVGNVPLWHAPKMWIGQTAVILGGGPSLTPECFQSASRFQNRIAVNQAYELDPGAQVLLWIDGSWFDRNRKGILEHAAPYKITTRRAKRIEAGVKVMGVTQELPEIRTEPTTLFGNNSGHCALNLAYHFGASRIILLGFDMHLKNGANWHTKHVAHASPTRFASGFLPAMIRAVEILQRVGIEVINCSPGSALKCCPIMSIEEVR